MSVTNALMDVLFLLFRANNTNNGSTAIDEDAGRATSGLEGPGRFRL